MTGQSHIGIYATWQLCVSSRRAPIPEAGFIALSMISQRAGNQERGTMIHFSYRNCDRYSDDRVEVFANKAQIGTLSCTDFMTDSPEQLCWNPDLTYNVKFQFRNEDTFRAVIEELRMYKNKYGYKYLTICKYNNGYASTLDKGMLERAGFKELPDANPAYLYLE